VLCALIFCGLVLVSSGTYMIAFSDSKGGGI
jgi:hypothetical protein